MERFKKEKWDLDSFSEISAFEIRNMLKDIDLKSKNELKIDIELKDGTKEIKLKQLKWY